MTSAYRNINLLFKEPFFKKIQIVEHSESAAPVVWGVLGS